MNAILQLMQDKMLQISYKTEMPLWDPGDGSIPRPRPRPPRPPPPKQINT